MSGILKLIAAAAGGGEAPAGTFDIANATVSSTLDVNSQDTAANGVAISADGTTIHVVGDTGNDVQTYDLSTPFLASSGTASGTPLDLTGETSSPAGCDFSADGTKFYVVGRTENTVFQYTCSPAWDTDTAVYATKSLVVTEDTNLRDLSFSPDGTKVVFIHAAADKMVIYTLSTAWDISSGTTDTTTLDVTSELSNPLGISITPAGTQVFIVGVGGVAYEYTLPTPFSLTSASYASISKDLSGTLNNGTGMVWANNNLSLYIADGSANIVAEFDVP